VTAFAYSRRYEHSGRTPGRAHTAPNAKRTGDVHLDAARQGTLRVDAAHQGAELSDASCHGTMRPDGVATPYAYRTRSGRVFSYWTQPCQGIFLRDAAVSGQMASRRRVLWHPGHASCQGTEHRNAAGSKHRDSIRLYLLYVMYIYIRY
jgi:hypothetical protein